MAYSRLLMLLALLACLMAATLVRADDAGDFEEAAPADDEEAEDDYIPEAKEGATQYIESRVVFVGHEGSTNLKFAAGEKVSAFVSFQNKAGGFPSELIILASHINQIGNPEAYVQNFSAIRTPRAVKGGETVTIEYEFRPDAMLEPMDYNLVVRVFFADESNANFASVAYNNTVTITEPLGTDPKTIMTYLIILALIGGTVYIFSGKNLVAAFAKKSNTRKVEPSSVITDDKTYNKDYVSDEHHKFREQVMQAAAARGSPKSSSPKGNRKASPSPNKKN